MKHENSYPLTGLPFDLSSSQTRSSLFVKQNRKLEKDFYVNLQWPGKPGFPQKIQVYIVPVNWFSQLNFLFLVFYFFIFFYFVLLFLFFCFCFICLLYQSSLGAGEGETLMCLSNTCISFCYEICLVDRFVVQLELVAIDHKCTCFIIYGLKFD